MKTKFKFLIDPSFTKISAGELAMLLEGSAYTVEKELNPYELPSALTKVSPIKES